MGQSIRTIIHGKSESRSTMSVTKQRSSEQLENEFVGLGFERLGQQSLLWAAHSWAGVGNPETKEDQNWLA
jgi:hypothetical protein